MSELLKQLESYKETICRCIDNADHIIMTHGVIKHELDAYKVQMFDLKMKIVKHPLNSNRAVDLQNQLEYLEGTTFSLAELADKALFTAVGRIGVTLDELRIVNAGLHGQAKEDLPTSSSELAMVTLEKCKMDIEGVCGRLINCFALEEGVLKKILTPRKI